MVTIRKRRPLKVGGDLINDNKANINTGTVGGHNVNISDPAAKKIIEKDRITIERELSIDGYLQTIGSLEVRIKDLERVIEAKDALISVLQNKS